MNAIADVITTPLKVLLSKQGKVMHMLRADAEHYCGFGEVFMSASSHDCVKAWKAHKNSESFFAVVKGKAQFVLYDARKNSDSYGQIQEIISSPEAYQLIMIPRNIVYGYKGLSSEETLIMCLSTLPHDPEEIVRYAVDSQEIPYQWV